MKSICKNCGKEIVTFDARWFHAHNCVTFCDGKALDGEHQPAPVAEPIIEEPQA